MSDSNHPQDQKSTSGTPDKVPLPRDKELEAELEQVKAELEAPRQDIPAVPSDLESSDDVQLEREVGTVRRERIEIQGLEEGVKDFGFRRKVLVAVLCILGLVAAGSFAVVIAGIAAGMYPLAAGAVLPLSGSGGLSVVAWRTYVAAMPSRPEPSPTGEGP